MKDYSKTDSIVGKVFCGLMQRKEFGFCIAHRGDNNGYIDGAYARIEAKRSGCGEYVVFTLHKKDYNREFNREFRESLCDWFNENYPDYHPNFRFENTSEEDELCGIKRDGFLYILNIPKNEQIIENFKNVRATMLDYIVKHPYFVDDTQLEIDIRYTYTFHADSNTLDTEKTRSIGFDECDEFYVTLVDGNQIPIDATTTDTLYDMINEINRLLNEYNK